MIINKKVFVFLCLIAALVPFKFSYSQFDPHPELDWFTIETKHFLIDYHNGTERTAQTVAKIAEEVYLPITSLYKYKPDEKVIFVINDVSDIANGATDYYGNRIEIYASPLDYDLRGTHNWLRNVITHEFTHAVQIQSAMKFSRDMPAIYLQWLNYEKERRPDVLYGYPNVIVSYPISGVGVPAWYAEGTAQYQRQQLSYDYWDANRDMILRSGSIDNAMLSWNEIGQFSSITSLKAETIYNTGFGLVRYIADKYGEDKLREISTALSQPENFSMDKAFRETLHKDGDEVYNEFKAYLKNDYDNRLSAVRTSLVKGKIIDTMGFANYYPHYSPDGKKIAYLSNQDYDYGTTALMLYDVSTKKSESLTLPVSTNFSWSPDGSKIIFAKRNSPPNIHGATIFDLYTWDIASKKETRLSENRRAYSPSYSRDGKLICYVVNRDGTLNLQYADADGKNNEPLTAFNNGEQVFNPIFTPDGKNIIFDYSFEESRKLARINIETGNIDYIIEETGLDYRTPFLNKEGTKLYYSSNKTGIFNIYSMDLGSKEIRQITNVTGGAFMPSINEKSDLVYSEYTSKGFKIAQLEGFNEVSPSALGSYNAGDRVIQKYADFDSTSSSGMNWNRLKNFNDKDVKKLVSKPYENQFTSLFFVPVLRIDNYTKDNNFLDAIKPGVYVFSSEAMNRFSIFGGASINRKLERDIFMQFQYDNGIPLFKDFFTKTLKFSPSFNIDGYNVSRKSTGDLVAGTDTVNVGITYDLLSFDMGMSFKLFNVNHNFKVEYTFSKYSYSLDPFILPQNGLSVRSSSQDYFKASNIAFYYRYGYTFPNRNSDINPTGRKIDIQYDYESSKINPELTVNDDGTTTTNFEPRKLHKLQAELFEGYPLFKDHSISYKLKGATIFGPQVEDFYNFYASGLPGMKGYPFYSLGGGRMFTANLTYRFPIATHIDTRISPLYLDKLYFSIYGDIGNAWEENNVSLKDFKKDVGAELRLQAFSYYVFPTSIFLNAAYGLDEFTKRFRGADVTYGKEVRLYFGILFGFDL
ncbi:hypothetical protein BH10BAC5_BH10BAC5_03890 [soil metagenome]